MLESSLAGAYSLKTLTAELTYCGQASRRQQWMSQAYPADVEAWIHLPGPKKVESYLFFDVVIGF